MNTKNTKYERKLRSFEALQIALAVEDAKHMPDSPEIERQVDRLYAAGRRHMAQLRYAESVLWPLDIRTNDEIRPEVQAMSRAEVEARIATLRVEYPHLSFAYRDSETLSDHDLRVMLEDALRLTEDEE